MLAGDATQSALADAWRGSDIKIGEEALAERSSGTIGQALSNFGDAHLALGEHSSRAQHGCSANALLGVWSAVVKATANTPFIPSKRLV